MITALFGSHEIKVATYNVENLFDLNLRGDEYPEYIPNTSWKWNRDTYNKKLKNISHVISNIDADIIALQEIESLQALKDLKTQLQRDGLYYQHYAMPNGKNTNIKVAILSKIPIKYSKEISVTSSRKYRNILEVRIDLELKPLYIFVNHWKAKSGSESERIISAKALKKRLDELGTDKEIILLGDFNSHYKENIIFMKNRKHNDTNGITGINDILKTSPKYQNQKDSFYNLWYEIDQDRRWSHKYNSKKESLDNIIISKGLMDSKNIEYVKKSFDKFEPKYLFYRKNIYRWEQSKNYPKHHTGKGYSDHLPIFAKFKI